jgi:AP2-associated kinase
MFEEFEKYTTLMYRPPEMIDKYKRFNVSQQADIWMLGCVLYTLCFCQHPFQEA